MGRGKENCISEITIYRGLEYTSVCEKGVTPLLLGKIREVKRCYWSRLPDIHAPSQKVLLVPFQP